MVVTEYLIENVLGTLTLSYWYKQQKNSGLSQMNDDFTTDNHP